MSFSSARIILVNREATMPRVRSYIYHKAGIIRSGENESNARATGGGSRSMRD